MKRDLFERNQYKRTSWKWTEEEEEETRLVENKVPSKCGQYYTIPMYTAAFPARAQGAEYI